MAQQYTIAKMPQPDPRPRQEEDAEMPQMPTNINELKTNIAKDEDTILQIQSILLQTMKQSKVTITFRFHKFDLIKC
jgi:hypothetical protein